MRFWPEELNWYFRAETDHFHFQCKWKLFYRQVTNVIWDKS